MTGRGRHSLATFVLLAVGCGFRDDPERRREFTATASPAQVDLVQGGTASFEVSLDRSGGYKGPVTVSVADLPPYVSAPDVEIPKGEDVATITLSAGPEAVQQGPVGINVRISGGDHGLNAPLALLVRGPSGTLDERFADGGLFVADLALENDRISALAVDADGRIVAAGRRTNANNIDFLVVRFDALGSLDGSFGGGAGWVTTASPNGQNDVANAVAIGSGGTIVVAGTTFVGTNDIALARYLPDGTLDASLNPSGGLPGFLANDLAGGSDDGFGVVAMADGRITVAGRATRGGTGDDIALVRYLPTGARDATLGTAGGVVFRDVSAAGDQGMALAQAGTDLVVAGFGTHLGTTVVDAAVARWTEDGDLVTGFGAAGLSEIAFSTFTDRANAAVVQTDGRVVIAGRAGGVAGSGEWFLARLEADGSRDATFGTDGVVAVDVFGGSDNVFAVALQPDGSIVVGGSVVRGGILKAAVARFLSDGSTDESFGDGGWSLVEVGGISDEIFALVLLQDGRIVVGGRAQRFGTGDDYFVGSLWP